MIVHLYRYPHPFIPDKWLYVGQGIKRDPAHRSGRSSFGRRFKKLFPDIPFPQPVRWTELVLDYLEANEAETVAMFQYHTWRGYSGGMNLTLPGSKDYEHLGHLGGSIGGEIGGRKNANKLGFLARISRLGARKGGLIGGLIQGRINKDKKTGVCAPGVAILGGKVAGRITKKNGTGIFGLTPEQQKAFNRKGGLIGGPIGMCQRWNINRGKSCTCGKHETPVPSPLRNSKSWKKLPPQRKTCLQPS